MTQARREPVTANLLTGFLGAGKTTLLRRLLRQPSLQDTAVLINEFGEVGLDHLLVEAVAEDVVLLKSGCICCTIRGDVKEALERLHTRRAQGVVPSFSRLIIETTGLADPAPLVATLTADPMLRHHYRMGNIVTVVDAVNGASNLLAFEEAQRQVAAADRIILSKTDLADEQSAGALQDRLASLNPTAEILRLAEDEDAPAALIVDDLHEEGARPREVRRWFAASARSEGHSAIRSFVIEREEPLDWAAFGLWLSMLLNRHGTAILRLKGLVAVEGIDSPVVVQGVQHLVHRPLHLAEWPDAGPRTRLVVIAQGIDPALVQRSFDAFMRVGAPPRGESVGESGAPAQASASA